MPTHVFGTIDRRVNATARAIAKSFKAFVIEPHSMPIAIEAANEISHKILLTRKAPNTGCLFRMSGPSESASYCGVESMGVQ